MAHTSRCPQTSRDRLTTSREAARSAERESVAIKAAVDQRLAESADCLRMTAEVLLRLPRPLPRLLPG